MWLARQLRLGMVGDVQKKSRHPADASSWLQPSLWAGVVSCARKGMRRCGVTGMLLWGASQQGTIEKGWGREEAGVCTDEVATYEVDRPRAAVLA